MFMSAAEIAGLGFLVFAWIFLLAWQARRIWNLHPLLFVPLLAWGVTWSVAPFLFIPDDSLPDYAIAALPAAIGPVLPFSIIWALHIQSLEAQRTHSQFVLLGQAVSEASKDMAAAISLIDDWVSLGAISKRDGERFKLNARVATKQDRYSD